MAYTTPSADHVQQATDVLLDAFTNGTLPAAIAPRLFQRTKNRPSDFWSLGNQMIMILWGRTEDARGFRQWEEVGRHVKKGARAFYILAPLTRTITVKDEETGEETKKTVVTGFKGIPVFRYEDTEGRPLESGMPTDFRPEPLPLEDVARAWGYRIEYGPTTHGEYAFTAWNAGLIHMSTDDPLTFWHELGHAADARHHDMKNGQHPDQEIVAEMVAAILAIAQGHPLDGKIAWARDYIEAYAKMARKTLLAAMLDLLGRVQEAIADILTTADTLATAAKTA